MIAAFLLAPRFVIAKNTFKVPANPGSFDAVKNIIGFDEYEPPHLIPKELKNAQCGGWDFTDTISTPDGKLEASKIPEVKVSGESLSKIRVYAKDVNDNIMEIGTTNLDINGDATITSNAQLKGGENLIFVVDENYHLSSSIRYVTVVDPWGYVYDSVSKQKLS